MPITRYAPATTASAAPPPALPTEATGADALAFTYKRAPVPIVRGDGVMLIDADGHEFLDLASGIAVTRWATTTQGSARRSRRHCRAG